MTPAAGEAVHPQEFVAYDPEEGTVVSSNGLRLMMADMAMVLALHQAVKESAGDRAAEMLYQIGVDWGERQYQTIESEILETYPLYRTVHEMPWPLFLECCNRQMMALGWGSFSLTEDIGQLPFVMVTLQASCVAQALGEAEGWAYLCHLSAGFFAGLFSKAADRELGCAEERCVSRGGVPCRFRLGSREKFGGYVVVEQEDEATE